MLQETETHTKISVIVPLYKGKKYLSNIMNMLLENQEEENGRFVIELILINDFPEEKISYDDVAHVNKIHVVLLTNQENRGIHYSRVRGLSHASGEYIHFLDQDDSISDHYFRSQIQHLGVRDDVIVANGTAEYESYSKLLYRYRFMQWTVKSAWFYIKFDCRIISPGQCLIRKDSIPNIWKTHILRQNGADDYFLWLVMLSQGKKFGINREALYTHKYTSANASSDTETMRRSVEEMLSAAAPVLGHSKVNAVQKRIQRNHVGKMSEMLVTFVENINRN